MFYISKILKFEFSNVMRSKWVLFLFSFFLVVSYVLFAFEDNFQKSILSLFNLIIYLVPLISLIFGTMYFYNSKEYIEMMLCQPIPRPSLYIGLYFGTSLPLILSQIAGITLPFLLFSNSEFQIEILLLLFVILTSITLSSIAISFFISTKITDKVKGLSASIFFWLIMALAFDGLLLLMIYLFEDYPIEKILLFIMVLNPINLSRTLFVLNFDISALMGFTGALFKKFYGSYWGSIVSSVSLMMWIAIPFYLGLTNFRKKDF